MKTGGKLGILGCLYFAQGLPYGFFTLAMPLIMRERGASLPQIGLASLLTLPWALKFLWAPLIDRYGLPAIGIRKTWLFALQALGIILFLTMAMMDGRDGYAWLLWGFLLANLIAATQDIATDGLAVNMLEEHERGVGNGLQVAGYRLGMICGGGFLLMYFPQLDFGGVFLLMGLAILVSTLPVLIYKEPPLPADHLRDQPWSLLWQLLTNRKMLLWLMVIGLFKFGDAMATAMFKPWLFDWGFSKEAIGGLLGYLGALSGLAGALVGGWLTTYIGRYRAVIIFGFIQSLPIFGYFLLDRSLLPPDLVVEMCILEIFTGGLATSAIFTAMMDVCRPHAAATDYTLQASFVVIATTLAHTVSGFVAGSMGYGQNFLISGILTLFGTALFGFLYRKSAVDHLRLSL